MLKLIQVLTLSFTGIFLGQALFAPNAALSQQTETYMTASPAPNTIDQATPHDFAALRQLEPASLAEAEPLLVVEIVDGDTVFLEDGQQVRLIGIQAPKLSLGREHVSDWPLGEESKQALADLILGHYVSLHYGSARKDRYGRTLAHLFLGDGRWVQGKMLEMGMARQYSFSDNRKVVFDLQAAETRARDAKLGVWALEEYAIQQASSNTGPKNSYQLVEGTVQSVQEKDQKLYLNFGSDWRTDFTTVIPARFIPSFDKTGLSPELYKGRHIRVRGWIFEKNGPMMELTHPGQIQPLDE